MYIGKTSSKLGSTVRERQINAKVGAYKIGILHENMEDAGARKDEMSAGKDELEMNLVDLLYEDMTRYNENG